MPLQQLDHVNIRTADLAGLRRFYTAVLGMADGFRPGFGVDGAWLYAGGRAAVHLMAVEPAAIQASPAPPLQHFAFTASGLSDFLAGLRHHGVAYQLRAVPEAGVRQVNLQDPDGNHLHVDFALTEPIGESTASPRDADGHEITA